MGFFLLVIVCGLYYVVYFTSVIYSEGLKVLQLIVYAAVFILYLIPFLFMKEDYYSMQNYMIILNMGVGGYAWMAIKGFWTKPLKLKREKLIKKTQGSISEEQYENIESLTIIIEAAKYKGIISMIISFIFMVSMTNLISLFGSV
nr:DUF5080 family protein [Mammaliicoccus sp. Marseille-Q6498]